MTSSSYCWCLKYLSLTYFLKSYLRKEWQTWVPWANLFKELSERRMSNLCTRANLFKELSEKRMHTCVSWANLFKILSEKRLANLCTTGKFIQSVIWGKNDKPAHHRQIYSDIWGKNDKPMHPRQIYVQRVIWGKND